jgi:hypothetical protein
MTDPTNTWSVTTGEVIMTNPTTGWVATREVTNNEATTLPSYDEEFLNALHRMHDLWLTKYDKPALFRPYDLLTRQEAAKFFAQFGSQVLYRTLDQTRYCAFDDMDWVDPSLKNYIIQACMLHMFGWSGGYFFPFDTFTKGQALAVLMRGLVGYEDETGIHRWGNYRQKARDRWLTKDVEIANGTKPVTRYEVALLLWRAAQKIE